MQNASTYHPHAATTTYLSFLNCSDKYIYFPLLFVIRIKIQVKITGYNTLYFQKTIIDLLSRILLQDAWDKVCVSLRKVIVTEYTKRQKKNIINNIDCVTGRRLNHEFLHLFSFPRKDVVEKRPVWGYIITWKKHWLLWCSSSFLDGPIS